MNTGYKDEIYLKQFEIFSKFEVEELEFIKNYLEMEDYGPGDHLLYQNKNNSKLFLIVNGDVRVDVDIPQKTHHQIAALGEKNFFGEVSMLSGQLTTASIIANTNVQCYTLSRSALETIKRFRPLLANKIQYSIALESTKKIRNTILKIHNFQEEIRALLQKKPMQENEALKQTSEWKDLENDEIELKMLTEIKLFEKFSEDELPRLREYGRIIECKKEGILPKLSFSGKEFYILLNGSLELYSEIDSKLSTVHQGDIYGQLEFIDGKKDPLAVSAKGTILMMFSKDSLEKLKTGNFRIWLKMFEIICTEVVTFLNDVNQKLVSLEQELDALSS